jgi:DNA-binding transcriptional MocR family regulator
MPKKSGRDIDLTIKQYIVNDLCRAIANRELPPGAKILTEKQMEVHYDTSRTTVRSARAELIGRGMLEVKQAKGTYVVGNSPENTVPLTNGVRFRVRMPRPAEADSIGAMEKGEPIIEAHHPDGRTEIFRTLTNWFEATCS